MLDTTRLEAIRQLSIDIAIKQRNSDRHNSGHSVTGFRRNASTHDVSDVTIIRAIGRSRKRHMLADECDLVKILSAVGLFLRLTPRGFHT